MKGENNDEPRSSRSTQRSSSSLCALYVLRGSFPGESFSSLVRRWRKDEDLGAHASSVLSLKATARLMEIGTQGCVCTQGFSAGVIQVVMDDTLKQ